MSRVCLSVLHYTRLTHGSVTVSWSLHPWDILLVSHVKLLVKAVATQKDNHPGYQIVTEYPIELDSETELHQSKAVHY